METRLYHFRRYFIWSWDISWDERRKVHERDGVYVQHHGRSRRSAAQL